MEEAARHPTVPPVMQAARDDYNRYTSLRPPAPSVPPSEPPTTEIGRTEPTEIGRMEPTEPPAAPDAPEPAWRLAADIAIYRRPKNR